MGDRDFFHISCPAIPRATAYPRRNPAIKLLDRFGQELLLTDIINQKYTQGQSFV
jgi:hypothetical protein